MAVRRSVLSLSLSPTNPDAVRVQRALDDLHIPPRERSIVLLGWLAAYLDGATMAALPSQNEPALSEIELDALLGDF